MAARVTVVGLGPAGPEMTPPGTRELLERADAVFVRTARHPAVSALGPVRSFDRHYEEAATFEEVYERIAADLVAAAHAAAGARGGVVYAVPGSPLVAERTVELLRADPRVELEVVPAMSFLDLAWACLGIDPVDAGVRLVDATRFAEVAAGERGPLLLAQCWSAAVLSEVKLAVDDPRGDGGGDARGGGPGRAGWAPVATVLHHLGLDDEVVVSVGWDELDRAVEADHLTSVYVPELAVPVAGELVALTGLVRRLRQDCPWDRQQTHASLTRHLLEESYEVIDAVEDLARAEAGERLQEGGPASGPATAGAGTHGPEPEAAAVSHLEEELGDLLFQVYFHSRLAAEEGRFTLADVARGVHDKLVARHPHVFGDTVAKDASTVLANWEELKKQEKGRQSVTDGIPAALPALAYAAKLQRKAAGVAGIAGTGSPDDDRDRALAALEALAGWAGRHEVGSVEHPGSDADRAAGELLWAAAGLARRAGVEPEEALRRVARDFRDRLRDAEGAAGPDA